MRHSIATTHLPPSRLLRRMTLVAAFLLGAAVWVLSSTPPARAQDPKAGIAASPPAVQAPAKSTPGENDGRSITIDIRTDDSGKKSVSVEKPESHRAADATADAADHPPPASATGPGKAGKHVIVGISGNDREYDSFGDFAHSDPALFTMVVAIVGIIFLSPVLAIAMILGYRMRKARMLNETMLKLAERGAVLPADALGALASGSTNAMASTPPMAPYLEQAKQLRSHAAASDLRKGMIMCGIGVGLTMYSMLDDGTPNGLGLVLLFVGIGYTVLWWFEQRQLAPPARPAVEPGPAAGSDGRSGSA